MRRNRTASGRLRLAACGLAALAAFSTPAQVGDFDGDGTADVLLRDANGRWGYYGFLDVAAAPPARAPLTPQTSWQWAAGGDFNGDGRHDVLLRRDDGAWTFYPMDGARVAAGRGWASLVRGRDWRPVGVADLNGDGRDDVLLRRDDGQWAYYAMNGRNRIQAESGWAGLPRDRDWRLAGMGDFDGDGRADVLLRHVRGAWRLYAMDGPQPAQEGPGSPGFTRHTVWRVAGVGDFDGDGADDVLMRNHRGAWRYQTLAGDGTVGGGHIARLPRAWAWRLAGIGDLDGDGSDDILLRHADGRWRAAPMGAGSDGLTRPVDLPGDLSWRIPRRPVHLPDAAVRGAVAEALGLADGAWITADDLAGLASLDVRAAGGASDLSGLGAARRLRTLVLAAGDVVDLSPLAGLADLATLEAPDNRIADLAPLAGLAGLTRLELAGNRIGSVAPLSSLSALEHLALQRNDIADISPLAGLTGIRALLLSENRIGDIAPLSGLHALFWLGLDGNGIDDLGPVAGLAGLHTLWASRNRIGNISPLARLTGLRDLDLSRNRVADISPLADMTALRGLRLASNEIVDVAALAGLAALENLDFRANRVSDIAPLAGLAALRVLKLDRNNIAEAAPLAGLTALEELTLARNRIVDVSPLAGLTALRHLDLARNLIADLTPLSGLAELATLDLSRNAVADVTPLAALTSLSVFKLAYNHIIDISPLEALAMGEGGVLDVRSNPLNDAAAGILAVFAARGVAVASGGPRFEGIHNDNLAIIRVEEDIAADRLDLAAVSWTFLTHFEDVFDFLVVVTNVDSFYELDQPPYDYAGVFSRARNDVRGIGLEPSYDRAYGSAGQLYGVAHLTDNAHFYHLAAHEVMHAWANNAVPTAHQFHWGFSSADGVLGGFDIADLAELGDGRYAAGVFETGVPDDRRTEVPYSPIELYLAGYVPPEAVPDLWVAEDGAWAVDAGGGEVRTADGIRVFTASRVRTYTIEDIVARNGERLPTSGEAQWHFRAATILATGTAQPASQDQLERVSAFATWFGLPGDDGDDDTVNFWEATGGRGTFALDGLTSLRRPDPAEPTGLRASFGSAPMPAAEIAP